VPQSFDFASVRPRRGHPMVRQVFALLGVIAGLAVSADQLRPNILFVITDDQSFDALSVVQQEQGAAARFPWLETPHLDRLAAEGVRFRNAFVVSSLCSPSRAVNLTGRYNHDNGIASNFRPFPEKRVTQATLLRDEGYTTAYVGKWHMGGQRARPGFDHHATYVAHGRYQDTPFIVDGVKTPSEGWVDDVATDYAIDFVKRQGAEDDAPWLLMLGFKTPHQPWEPPERSSELYEGKQSGRPMNYATPPPYFSREPRPSDRNNQTWNNLNYFRCVSAMDECVGRLLEELERSGQASNTVVIFTSDNGMYLGAHKTGDKRSAYDESMRVPFIVRDPRLGAETQGRVVDEMVLNLDLVPSVLDLAGREIPVELPGRSWRPLLAGPVSDWRQSWFYEYFTESQRLTRVPDITAVRTKDAKLIKYVGFPEWTELFDLKRDPDEMKNLFHDAAATDLKETLGAEHDRLAGEIGFRVPDFVDRPDDWGEPGSLAGDMAER
jgi:arylsulfatase A-like enzyme